MRKQDLDRLARRLRGLHARLLTELEELEADALGESGRQAPPQSDAGTVDAAQETELRVLAQEELLLRDVVEALARLDRGDYGRCQACGAWIELERLEALPCASHCVACQARAEGA